MSLSVTRRFLYVIFLVCLFAATASLTYIYLERHNVALPTAISATPLPTLSLSFDSSVNQTDQQNLKQAFVSFASTHGYRVGTTNTDFQISATLQSGSFTWPLRDETVGEPQALQPGQPVIKSVTKPNLYMETANAKLPESLTTELATTLKTAAGASTKPTWTLKALGDVILGRTVYKISHDKNDYNAPFEKMADYTKSADYTIADLENVLSDSQDHPTLGMVFSSPAQAVNSLSFAGIDAVDLANNHAYNQGKSGFTQTLDTLKKANLPYFGGGMNSVEAHTPYIRTVNGVKVALLGYTSIIGMHEAGTNDPGQAVITMQPWGTLDETQLKQMDADIAAAKQQADVVIVYNHWSAEYTHDANADQRTVAHRAIDDGATLVLGSHPHWVQGIEWYKGKMIAYALGNFVFDQEWSIETKQGAALALTFSGSDLVQADFTPYEIEDYYQPRPVDATKGTKILNDIYQHSWWTP